MFSQGLKVIVPRIHCTLSPIPGSKDLSPPAENHQQPPETNEGSHETNSDSHSEGGSDKTDGDKTVVLSDDDEGKRGPDDQTNHELDNELDHQSDDEPSQRAGQSAGDDDDDQDINNMGGSPMDLMDSRSTKEYIDSCHSTPDDWMDDLYTVSEVCVYHRAYLFLFAILLLFLYLACA